MQSMMSSHASTNSTAHWFSRRSLERPKQWQEEKEWALELAVSTSEAMQPDRNIAKEIREGVLVWKLDSPT